MHWITWLLVIIIWVEPGGAQARQAAQKNVSRCGVDDKSLIAVNYIVGVSYEAPSNEGEGTSMTVVHVSVDPQHINREDLTLLAAKFKRDFCKEERLFLVLYDSAEYIRQVLWSSHPLFEASEASKRGYYYLNRKTGEEYVTYCTVSNYLRNPEKRVKIELGRASTQKPQAK